ncbi:substrate-binding domain-containing protein [Paracoccus sp. PAMC 22219]|uniref:substrate-binding domain-containing protein n=1 Tax=Paracoccus sp. PAMC 22219 TaxID=1569209 RepID=UPI000695F3E0
MLDRRFDLGVTDRDPRHPRIDAERMGQEGLCLVMPAGSPGPVPFSDLEALGLIDHPDCHHYAGDLLALNLSDDFDGADRLRVRRRVNQICQVTAPVAQGVGYTLLPRRGLAAFADTNRLRNAALPDRRHHERWSIMPHGHPLSAGWTVSKHRSARLAPTWNYRMDQSYHIIA